MNEFIWTARLFKDKKAIDEKYFETKEERDDFVLSHPEWKKRGKICRENLSKHAGELHE